MLLVTTTFALEPKCMSKSCEITVSSSFMACDHTTNTLVDLAAISIGGGAEMGYNHVIERQTGRKVEMFLAEGGEALHAAASPSPFNVAIGPKTGAKGSHIRKKGPEAVSLILSRKCVPRQFETDWHHCMHFTAVTRNTANGDMPGQMPIPV